MCTYSSALCFGMIESEMYRPFETNLRVLPMWNVNATSACSVHKARIFYHVTLWRFSVPSSMCPFHFSFSLFHFPFRALFSSLNCSRAIYRSGRRRCSRRLSHSGMESIPKGSEQDKGQPKCWANSNQFWAIETSNDAHFAQHLWNLMRWLRWLSVSVLVTLCFTITSTHHWSLS